jgi:hypothetical protein
MELKLVWMHAGRGWGWGRRFSGGGADWVDFFSICEISRLLKEYQRRILKLDFRLNLRRYHQFASL